MAMWTIMNRAVYLCFVLEQSHHIFVDIYPIGEPMKVVGLFSSCANAVNRSNLSLNAENYSKAWADYYSKYSDFQFLQDPGKDHYTITYLQFDVCDMETLANVTTKLLLDSENNLSDKINNHTDIIQFGEGTKVTNWRYQSKIIWIYTYLTEELDHHLAKLLVNLKVGVQNLRRRVAKFKNDMNYVLNYDIMEARNLLEFFRLLSFTSLTSIHFQKNYKDDFEDLYQQFNDLNALEIFTKCFKSEQISSTKKEMLEILHRLENEDDKSAIVLFGKPTDFVDFDKVLGQSKIKLHDRFWLLIARERLRIDRLQSMANSGRLYFSLSARKIAFFPKTENFVEQPGYILEIYHSWIHHYTTGFDQFDYSRFAESLYKDLSNIETQIERDERYINFYMETMYWKTKGGKCLYRENCAPGFEQRLVFHTEIETNWSVSKGYACRRCKNGYFKAVRGNSVCLKCRQDYLINEKQTECLDPFVDLYISFYRKPGSFILYITSLVICLVAAITGIFFVKRKSPLVRACDAKLSLLYLMGSLVVLLTIIPFFYGKPTQTICMLRPTVCIVVSWKFSLILIKSKKILSAFSAKTKLSRGNVKLDLTMQMVFSGAITLSPGILLFYLYNKELPTVVVIADRSHFTRYHTCSNAHHINLLVAYLIVLQLFCSVQAFRTRNIPNTFYNAMSIVYATFTGTLCFGIFFPIYYSQKYKLNQLYVQLIVLVINTGIFVVLQYFPVVWVILFSPNKNSKSHVRSKLLKVSLTKAESKIQTSSISM